MPEEIYLFKNQSPLYPELSVATVVREDGASCAGVYCGDHPLTLAELAEHLNVPQADVARLLHCRCAPNDPVTIVKENDTGAYWARICFGGLTGYAYATNYPVEVKKNA